MGPAADQQVNKFVNALMNDLEEAGVKDQPIGVDFIDINLMREFDKRGINWTDGMSPMMNARAIKSPDEIKAFQIVGAICDKVHYEITNFMKPGMTENEVAAFGFEQLYSIPGMEDVEDVIVSSGPNAWPNWRNFSDRMIRPGELVIIDLAALTWNGFKSCVYRTYCVGGKPTDEHQQTYDTAHKWLWDSIEGWEAGCHDRRRGFEVALGQGDVGIRGRGPGGGQQLGPRPRPRPVRPSRDLPNLVARPPGGDPARHDVRPGDPAREDARPRRQTSPRRRSGARGPDRCRSGPRGPPPPTARLAPTDHRRAPGGHHMTTVSDFIIDRLIEWDLHLWYGFPGDGIGGFDGALGRAERAGKDFRYIRPTHEEMAALMATAHAKFTGEVGVCIATSGPGAAHLVNGLYDAKGDNQPVARHRRAAGPRGER